MPSPTKSRMSYVSVPLVPAAMPQMVGAPDRIGRPGGVVEVAFPPVFVPRVFMICVCKKRGACTGPPSRASAGARTRRLAGAGGRRSTAIDGREVLLFQAIPRFRSMTGYALPAELARQVLGLEAGRA